MALPTWITDLKAMELNQRSANAFISTLKSKSDNNRKLEKEETALQSFLRLYCQPLDSAEGHFNPDDDLIFQAKFLVESNPSTESNALYEQLVLLRAMALISKQREQQLSFIAISQEPVLLNEFARHTINLRNEMTEIAKNSAPLQNIKKIAGELNEILSFLKRNELNMDAYLAFLKMHEFISRTWPEVSNQKQLAENLLPYSALLKMEKISMLMFELFDHAFIDVYDNKNSFPKRGAEMEEALIDMFKGQAALRALLVNMRTELLSASSSDINKFRSLSVYILVDKILPGEIVKRKTQKVLDNIEVYAKVKLKKEPDNIKANIALRLIGEIKQIFEAHFNDTHSRTNKEILEFENACNAKIANAQKELDASPRGVFKAIKNTIAKMTHKLGWFKGMEDLSDAVKYPQAQIKKSETPGNIREPTILDKCLITFLRMGELKKGDLTTANIRKLHAYTDSLKKTPDLAPGLFDLKNKVELYLYYNQDKISASDAAHLQNIAENIIIGLEEFQRLSAQDKYFNPLVSERDIDQNQKILMDTILEDILPNELVKKNVEMAIQKMEIYASNKLAKDPENQKAIIARQLVDDIKKISEAYFDSPHTNEADIKEFQEACLQKINDAQVKLKSKRVSLWKEAKLKAAEMHHSIGWNTVITELTDSLKYPEKKTAQYQHHRPNS